jgi:hypothetical protein
VYLPEELHKLWQLNELASKQLQELRRRDLKLMDSEQIMQHGLELNQTSDFLFAIFRICLGKAQKQVSQPTPLQ